MTGAMDRLLELLTCQDPDSRRQAPTTWPTWPPLGAPGKRRKKRR